jgi:prephenate dehydrogenase
MKVAIIGTGVIGGSIGLSVLERSLAEEVIGYDSDSKRLRRALEMSAITRPAESVKEAVQDADIVFIATPVGEVVSTFETIVPQLKDGAIVTDVGSAKERIVSEIRSLAPQAFVGGHPMAGSEREGIEAAQPDLFEGSYWVLTPDSVHEPGYSRLASFISNLGAEVIALEPKDHDELVGVTSHLPQVLASVLMSYAHGKGSKKEGLPLIAAGGFKDMTRIAASSTDLWMDILKDNRESLTGILKGFRTALESAEDLLRESNWEGLREIFDSARSARKQLQDKPGVAAEDLSVVTVLVPDRPGVLSEVTTAIGEVGVNIEDMQITHSSQGGRGSVRLTLSGESAAEVAIKALAQKGYTARSHDR